MDAPVAPSSWWFVLASAIIGIVLSTLGRASAIFLVLYLAYGIGVIVPSIAVAVRRLHDTNRSGWWYLLVLIPLVGAIILIVFLATDGTPGLNQYGPPAPPLARPDPPPRPCGGSHPRTHLGTCVRAGRRRRSSTPTSTRSTRRSSSATTRRCAAGRSSSAGASCSPPATRPRRSACARPWAAGRRCGSARTPSSSSPRMTAYSEASKAVFEVFDDTTPLVEGLSIDEAFLDVGGLRRVSGTPVEIAARLRAEVRERVGLPITVGVARTKFLAKVASAVAKPDGLLVVAPGAELGFLHPLPVERLWGVGAEDGRQAARPRHHDRRRRGAASAEGPLVSILGPFAGRHLHALAHNRDPRRVEVGRRRRSIGSQHAIGRSRHGPGRRRSSTPSSSASSTASRGGCAPPTASGARSSCGCASTTSPGHPVAHDRRADRGDRDRARRGPRAARRGDAD